MTRTGTLAAILSGLMASFLLAGEQELPPRVHLFHAENRELLGTSTNLIAKDPWLAYVFGRGLVARSFTTAGGARAGSCWACHGAGAEGGAGTCRDASGETRDVPALYGVGLVELLADAIRQETMRQLDANGDGWVSLAESEAKEVWIAPGPTEPKLFFGRADDADHDGQPDLDPIYQWWFVNASGEPVPASRLSDPLVAGYQLRVAPFQHRGQHRTSSLRAVLVQAMSDSLGLEAHDESFERDPDGDGVARYSPAGALQFACDRAPDRGLHKSSAGLSLDDPDHDGACEELTEGDIDVGEWYLLNLPQPAVHEQGGAARRGAELLVEMGCTDCHTPRWQFPSARARHGDVAVDRRFFELQVREVTTSHLWHAEVLPLTTPSSGESRRSLAALRVDGIYSDLRSHRIHADPGAPSVRTRPLWGVASTAPYMSDGSASSLQEAILKHDGEAAEARAAFESAPTEDQRTLLAFLRSLALFSFEDLATSSLLVRGPTPVGCSRFAPELWTAAFRRYWERQNGQVPSLLGPEAFGMDLPFLQDRDHDGLPDAVAPTPDLSGVASKGF